MLCVEFLRKKINFGIRVQHNKMLKKVKLREHFLDALYIETKEQTGEGKTKYNFIGKIKHLPV